MINPSDLVRDNILKLVPYASAKGEFSGDAGIYLDANENPYGTYNRYPDPLQMELRNRISTIKKVDPMQLFISNGSDEIIDMTYRIFCQPGVDKSLHFPPTFGMFNVNANINGTQLLNCPLDENFQIDREKLEPFFDEKNLKVIFVCSPNNPTGNDWRTEDIQYILDRFKGVVFVDEAYIDFAGRPSWVEKINDYPNLVVNQTFSKAWGMAAARVGLAIGHQDIIHFYNKVKMPYNISALNQRAVLDTLNREEDFKKNLAIIIEEKEKLGVALKDIDCVLKVYPSNANFFLVKFKDANHTYKKLLEHSVVTRNRHTQIENCIRISVGNPKDNLELLRALRTI